MRRIALFTAPLCLVAVVLAFSAARRAESADTGSDGLAALESFISMQNIDKSRPDWKQRVPKPIEADFKGKQVTWKLVTNVGNIDVRLLPDSAPFHVTSTVYLTELGFYDDTLFHRVIPGFMAQGGDPTGTGRGGPGYKYDGEFDPKVKHDKRGILSMANAGPGTDGSQFFLTFVPTPHLDGKHTIFGEVVGGMETLAKLEEKGSGSGRTTAELKIVTATVEVK